MPAWKEGDVTEPTLDGCVGVSGTTPALNVIILDGASEEVQLKATDPGLVALATAIAGVTPKAISDVVTSLTALQGTTPNFKTLYDIWYLLSSSGGIKVATLPDCTNSVLTNSYGTTAAPADWSKYLAIKSQALQDVWDSTNHNLQVTSDNDFNVNNLTVAAGKTIAISTGQEYTCAALDVGGTVMNMGYLRCSSCTIEAGGQFISGPGSVKEIFAGY